MLSIFLCAFWPSVYILWENVYSGLLHIFKKCICLFTFGCTWSSLLHGLVLAVVSWGCSPAVHWLLIVVGPLVVKHGLGGAQSLVVVAYRLSSCSSWALEHRLNSCAVGA